MIRLRAAQASDCRALALLHESCFADCWPADAFRQLLALPGTFGLLAGEDGQAVGLIMARTAADEAEILSLCVSEAARRNGIATAMLVAAGIRAGEAGATRVFLEVDAANRAAYSLYHKMGFRQVGRRPAYYRQSSGEGLTLRAELASAALGNEQEVD